MIPCDTRREQRAQWKPLRLVILTLTFLSAANLACTHSHSGSVSADSSSQNLPDAAAQPSIPSLEGCSKDPRAVTWLLPEAVLRPTPNCRVSGILESLDEGDLRTTNAETQILRALWIRTQGPPAMVRLVRAASKCILFTKTGAGDNTHIGYYESRVLSSSDCDNLRTLFAEANFALEQGSALALDDSIWVFEWSVDGRYGANVVSSLNLPPPVRKLARAMLRLANLPEGRGADSL